MLTSEGAPARRAVFFGDSRAAWWPVPALPGLACVASGVPGATVRYLARRFAPMVAPLRPDIVVVQMEYCMFTPCAERARLFRV